MKAELLAMFTLLAACGDGGDGDGGGADAGVDPDAEVEPPDAALGTAHVSVTDGIRPLAGVPVVFQGADGRMLAVVVSDVGGGATGPMEPDGMVTFPIGELPTWALVTETGIQPGSDVEVGRRVADDPVVGHLTPIVPGGFAGAQSYRIQIGCDFNNAYNGDSNWAPGNDPVTLEVTQSCVSATNTVSVAATAYIGETAVAYTVVPAAALDDDDATELTLPAWQTDFDTLTYSLSGLDAGATSANVILDVLDGTHHLAYVTRGFDDVSSGGFSTTLNVPHGLPMARLKSGVRFDGEDFGGVIGIDRAPAVAASTALTQADYLPRITAATVVATGDPARPRVTWSYAAAFPSITRLELGLDTGDLQHGWSVRMPAGVAPTELRFPELPAQLANHRPTAAASFSRLRLEVEDTSGIRYSRAYNVN